MAGRKKAEMVDEPIEAVEMTEQEISEMNEEPVKKKRTTRAKKTEPEEAASKKSEPKEDKEAEVTGEDEGSNEEANRKAEIINDDPVKEIDPDALVAKNTSRFAYEVEKASKKQKRDMYKSEHVITEYGDEEVETEATMLRRDYLELVASAKSHKILEGMIMGYRYAGEMGKSTLLAEIEYGSGYFNVLIPSYLLYDYEVSKYVEHDKLQKLEVSIKRRVGSKIKFVVRHVDEKNQVAYADRLEAQSIIGYTNYLKQQRDEKPRIVNDMIVKSQVIYTSINSITVDALGVDITIPASELSHMYVGDARQEFTVGEMVNVRVTDIKETTVEKNGTKYRLVTANGSIKAATPDKKKKLYDQFQVDGVYAAKITYVEEAGVFCRLRGNVDCLCALPRFGRNPKRDDVRMVRITEKDDESMFIFGVLVN